MNNEKDLWTFIIYSIIYKINLISIMQKISNLNNFLLSWGLGFRV